MKRKKGEHKRGGAARMKMPKMSTGVLVEEIIEIGNTPTVEVFIDEYRAMVESQVRLNILKKIFENKAYLDDKERAAILGIELKGEDGHA